MVRLVMAVKLISDYRVPSTSYRCVKASVGQKPANFESSRLCARLYVLAAHSGLARVGAQRARLPMASRAGEMIGAAAWTVAF